MEGQKGYEEIYYATNDGNFLISENTIRKVMFFHVDSIREK